MKYNKMGKKSNRTMKYDKMNRIYFKNEQRKKWK